MNMNYGLSVNKEFKEKTQLADQPLEKKALFKQSKHLLANGRNSQKKVIGKQGAPPDL